MASALRLTKVWDPSVVVHLGDLQEAQAASKWPEEERVSLDSEYKAAAAVLHEIRQVSGNADLILLDGNHDANIAAPHRLPPAVRSLCQSTRDEWLGPELKKWKRVPYVNGDEGAYWLEKVCFKHGCSSNEEGEAILFAGDTPSPLIVGGHTHRPKCVTQCKKSQRVPLQIWYMNGGTLGPLKPQYAIRDNTRDWGRGLVVGAVAPRSRWQPGRLWTAQTIPLQ